VDPEAQARGRRAERVAAGLLKAAGYEVLARNLRTRHGEIDLVAREGGTLVIVEVRYRAPHVVAAWESLSARKRQALLRAGHEARALLRISPSTPLRFDVVLVCADGNPLLVRGALD
jgi:putative endonuclease